MANQDLGPARIFICYRRGEVAWPAGWLYEHLSQHFSSSEIFKDVDSIELGDDFVASITSAVESCDVLLAIIGPTWLTLADEDGNRRLNDPGDLVRIEIETALRRGIRVIPVLVDGAVMPAAKALPRSLKEFARRQALELNPVRFQQDASRLVKVLERSITQPQASRQAQLESSLKPARQAATSSPASYQQEISRTRPGCVAIMVDQSAEMGQPLEGRDATLADEAARLVNDMLMELCIRSQKGPGKVEHLFDVSAFGYGARPDDAAETLEPLLPTAINAKWVPITDIRENPRRVEQRQVGDNMLRFPVWVEPRHGHSLPLCKAIAELGAYIYEWAQVHTDSFPPLIINITAGGFATDSPYEAATADEWLTRLTMIGTANGSALLANILVSPNEKDSALFPASGENLPPPVSKLFAVTSPLPPGLITHIRTKPGARMMGLNQGTALLDVFRLG